MKNRVRMIVVLVCVFVVLPVVGGLVYLSRISAEAAARYYAEAIAQGRFEDAMGVESSELSSKVGEVTRSASKPAVVSCQRDGCGRYRRS